MATRKNEAPDFFKEETFDPVEVATKQSGQGIQGKPGRRVGSKMPAGPAVNKKKPVFIFRLNSWIALPASFTN